MADVTHEQRIERAAKRAFQFYAKTTGRVSAHGWNALPDDTQKFWRSLVRGAIREFHSCEDKQ